MGLAPGHHVEQDHLPEPPAALQPGEGPLGRGGEVGGAEDPGEGALAVLRAIGPPEGAGEVMADDHEGDGAEPEHTLSRQGQPPPALPVLMPHFKSGMIHLCWILIPPGHILPALGLKAWGRRRRERFWEVRPILSG